MNILKRFLFVEETSIKREEQIWNAVFSMLNAVQSVLFLFFTTRICGEDTAGVFSLAFSVAYLMIMVGNYGVRNYQATDVQHRFRFPEYRMHRIITCILMMLFSVVYGAVKGYQSDKLLAVLLFCFLKMLESVEDVFHGAYQQRGRLDIAGKIGTLRYGCSVLGFIIVLIVTKNLVYAAAASVLLSLAALVGLLLYTAPYVEIKKEQLRWKECLQIFIICFPLFISSFFNMYICNASKYAIDEHLNDTMQGYYGMLFMPVFVINLLSSCIYRPHLVELANLWAEEKREQLRKFVFRQLAIISVICLFVVLAGFVAGTPVLSAFYGTNLRPYRTDLVILLVGGGMTAVVDFLNNIITVIRRQQSMVWIYGAVFLLAYVLTDWFVLRWHLLGASLAYFALLLVQSVIMLLYVVYRLGRPAKAKESAV